MKMQYRHAWKQKIPFTEVLSRLVYLEQPCGKKIRSGREHPLVYEIERVNGEFQVITNMNRQMELPVHK